MVVKHTAKEILRALSLEEMQRLSNRYVRRKNAISEDFIIRILVVSFLSRNLYVCYSVSDPETHRDWGHIHETIDYNRMLDVFYTTETLL